MMSNNRLGGFQFGTDYRMASYPVKTRANEMQSFENLPKTAVDIIFYLMDKLKQKN